MKNHHYMLFLWAFLMPFHALKAEEINTGFEFSDTSGFFTLTSGSATASFSGGEAKSIGNFSLYHSGMNAWMINPGTTGEIAINPPAQTISVYFRVQSGNNASVLELLDGDGQILISFPGSSSNWTEVVADAAFLGKSIAKVVLRNQSAQGYAVLDDLSLLTSDEPVEQRLDNPIPETIQKGSIRLRLKQIATGLTAPNWAIAAPGDSGHLYVGDQDGKIWRINLADSDKTVFLDLSDRLVPLGAFGEGTFDERGLLGFAFHPQFAENGLVYTYTSEPADDASDFSTIPEGASANHRSVIREWKLALPGLNENPVPVSTERVLLTVDQPQFNHNAGGLNFGPDGMLYVAFGDGGGADDRDGQIFAGGAIIGHGENGNGQNTANPLGSLLRIDPMGNNAANGQYGIPADNPFVGSAPVLNEIYAYGFRNPFRFSFDTVTGALVLADVGQNDIEEVNLVQPGLNYGWSTKEGSFVFDPNGDEAGFVTHGVTTANLIDPIVQYDHDEGTAIIGGFVYRGNAMPVLQQAYIFGDVARTGEGDGRLFYTAGNEILELDLTLRDEPGFWVLGFGQDAHGEIYVLGNAGGVPFGTEGSVYKLVPNAEFSAGFLDIPAVDVLSDNSGSTAFRARFQLVEGSDPLRFVLADAEKLNDGFLGDNAQFDSQTATLTLPFVNVVQAGKTISTYAAELQRVPDQPVLTFELKQATLLK